MPPRRKATPPNQPTPSQENDRALALVNKQHLELITEVRALSLRIGKLHTLFVKRRVLWWVLGIETFIVASAIIGLFVFATLSYNRIDRLVDKFHDSCQVRNTQINGTKRFITDTQRLQAESQEINDKLLAQLDLQLSPEDAKKLQHISREYKAALTRYQQSQPKSLSCDVNNAAGTESDP